MFDRLRAAWHALRQQPNAAQPNELPRVQGVRTALTPAVKLPPEVLDYTTQESEDWAVGDRQRRAAELFEEHGDWQLVLQALRREDGELA